MTGEEIRCKLTELADKDYQKFSSGLLPETKGILGGRLPVLRKIAKQIAKEDWCVYIADNKPAFFEEIMIQGMVIGYAEDLLLEERFCYIRDFLPLINNWSTCDSFCNGLKFAKENQTQTWDFLMEHLHSKDTYAVRFAVVMLLFYFINDTYIERVIKELDHVISEEYYVQMAVAWALSMCFVQYPDRMLLYLQKEQHLDSWTYQKTLQKICESHQVNDAEKQICREMKRTQKKRLTL